ncbi:VRR-NUC domain-containing protein [Halomonas sp. 18H]|nr:VRR-NUC domain-containing protein [Halomonas sp. 18H]MCW4152552.1 VRR-NUC domain-containing protein [Halomonas sp. 18H]
MNSTSAERVSASLDDPRYYLSNFQFVLDWVAARHHDLLDDAELAFLRDFPELPLASRALLVRMVMRRGEVFRLSRLDYAEIGDATAALAPLQEAGWVEADPECELSELFRQLRLPELREALAGEMTAAGISRSASKATLLEALQARLTRPRPLSEWWPQAPDRLVRVTVMPLCDRLRLMFFGNLRQDWAEFVLTELGMQRFESVAFDAASRAFDRRAEVDEYLFLHHLRERLDVGESPVVLGEMLAESPSAEASANAWLASRRARLLVHLGREAERQDETQAALELYARAGDGEGRIRRLRLLERCGEHARAHALLEQAGEVGEREAQALARLRTRLRRRLGLTAEPPPREASPERLDLTLPPTGGRVELAVAEHLATPEVPVYYVENALIGGLFGLLCWEALFAPLPGAFFHPFQSGPADLGREDFLSRRREHFEACLAELEDGRYRHTIAEHWQTKRGLSATFLHWERLSWPLIEQALDCLPAAHLRACFERILADPRANRSGLPDLIQFLPDGPAPHYRLIEVKGPGDRLQDNQRRWLSFFQARRMPVAVCHVGWQKSVGWQEAP